MKPYQFYLVDRFPKINVGESVKNDVQLSFSGENEPVETRITLIKRSFEGLLSLLRVRSEIKHSTVGFIKVVVNHERQKVDFLEYLEPVDFSAYLHADQGLMLFQAPKKVCRGVLANLRAQPCGVELAEVDVDFAKVMAICTDYMGAWF